MRIQHAFIAALSMTAISAPTAAADSLLKAMRELAETPVIYAVAFRHSEDDFAVLGETDPEAPEGQRMQITEPMRETWDDELRDWVDAAEKSVTGRIGCQKYADMVPDSAERVAESDADVTYRFTPQPGEDADEMQSKVLREATGTVRLDASDGAILSFEMALAEPVKPNFFVKVESFVHSVQCARSDEGHTYERQMDLRVQGSAMGQRFDNTVRRETLALLRFISS